MTRMGIGAIFFETNDSAASYSPMAVPRTTCVLCGFPFPSFSSRCPHCAHPSLYPNVTAAAAEATALTSRYDAVVKDAVARGVKTQVDGFEAAARISRAVLNREPDELGRLASSDDQLYATYYHLAKIRLPIEDEWDIPRKVADATFFNNYHEDIHFAALTLDSLGPKNWGSCSIILRESMISHRASAFVENTVRFIQKNKIVAGDPIPEGFRAIWSERAKLCVVKLGGRIIATTIPPDYAGLMLAQGANTASDEFVEVHIFGEMTVKTIEEVTFPHLGTVDRRTRKQLAGIREKLTSHGVKVN